MNGSKNTKKSSTAAYKGDHFGKRQPRPALRKQGTRKGAVLAAIREER